MKKNLRENLPMADLRIIGKSKKTNKTKFTLQFVYTVCIQASLAYSHLSVKKESSIIIIIHFRSHCLTILSAYAFKFVRWCSLFYETRSWYKNAKTVKSCRKIQLGNFYNLWRYKLTGNIFLDICQIPPVGRPYSWRSSRVSACPKKPAFCITGHVTQHY